MTETMNPYVHHVDLVKPLIDLSRTIEASGLEKSLLDLVKIRASQMNGCAVCLDMHAREARRAGETESRVLMLSAWRETGIYTAREKAALDWTEALTANLADHAGMADARRGIEAEFGGAEQVTLTLMIGVINSFNRIGVGFAVPPLGEQQRAA